MLNQKRIAKHDQEKTFSDEEIRIALQTVPRIPGVFEREYKPQYTASAYLNIAMTELSVARYELLDQVILRRLKVAEAAIDLWEYLLSRK